MNNLKLSLKGMKGYGTTRWSVKHRAIKSLHLGMVFKSIDVLKQETLSKETKLDTDNL